MTSSDTLTDLYTARDKAAADYAAMALWHRRPVEHQGDTGPRARRLRAEWMEQAAQRWLELSAEIERAQAEVHRISRETQLSGHTVGPR